MKTVLATVTSVSTTMNFVFSTVKTVFYLIVNCFSYNETVLTTVKTILISIQFSKKQNSIFGTKVGLLT